MYAIEYRKPKTLAEAAQALAQSGGKALAGGQSLVAAMKLRLAQPSVLVDIGLAMGPVIASIHEKRSQMRMEIMEQGDLAEEPSLGRRRLRDAVPPS